MDTPQENPQNQAPQNDKSSAQKKSWFRRHPIITVILGIFLFFILFILIAVITYDPMKSCKEGNIEACKIACLQDHVAEACKIACDNNVDDYCKRACDKGDAEACQKVCFEKRNAYYCWRACDEYGNAEACKIGCSCSDDYDKVENCCKKACDKGDAEACEEKERVSIKAKQDRQVRDGRLYRDSNRWTPYKLGTLPGSGNLCMVHSAETFESPKGEVRLLFGFANFADNQVLPVIASEQNALEFVGKSEIEITITSYNYLPIKLIFATLARYNGGVFADNTKDHLLGAFILFNSDDSEYFKTVYGMYKYILNDSKPDITVSGPFGTAHFYSPSLKSCHNQIFPIGVYGEDAY